MKVMHMIASRWRNLAYPLSVSRQHPLWSRATYDGLNDVYMFDADEVMASVLTVFARADLLDYEESFLNMVFDWIRVSDHQLRLEPRVAKEFVEDMHVLLSKVTPPASVGKV